MAKYEITSFTWNIVGVSTYILCYIILFFYLRMLRIGQTLDLKKCSIFLDVFMSQNAFNKILISFVVIGLVLLWILIFIRLRDILIREILKLHFYQKNKCLLTALENDTEPEFQKYNRFLFAIEKYTLERLLRIHIQAPYIKFVSRLIERKIITEESRLITILDVIINNRKASIRYSMLLLLIMCFLYDCIQNNFVLYITLMYLPIYMLFMLWHNISFFIEKSGIVLDRIIFERIYCKKWVLYVNLTRKEETLLDNCLKAKLIEDIIALTEAGYDPSTNPIVSKRRFIKLRTEERGEFYHNFEEHKTFYEKDIIIIDNRYYVNDPDDPEAMDELTEKKKKHDRPQNL